MARPSSGGKGMVSSAHPLASAAGVKVMEAGGNAVDAAVATSLVLGVVAPAFSGVGGGGFFMVRMKDRETVYIDYRETAPKRAKPGMFPLERSGAIKGFANSMGYLSAGVPGTVAGLLYTLEEYGNLSFKQVASHAMALARGGFEISPLLGTILTNNVDNAFKKLKLCPESGREWLNGPRPYRAGETKVSANLFKTLTSICDEGRHAFYNGRIARAIVDDFAQNGGLIEEDDLAGYNVEVRKPVKGTYRGYEIHAMPPPSLGGTAIIEVLNILEDMDLATMGLNTSETIAAVAKALAVVWPSLTRQIGDPAFVRSESERLTSKDHAAGLWFGRGERGAGTEGTGKNWTTHLSVADREGNVAAITESLECYFGSGITVPDCGFFLSDIMHDFDQGSAGPNRIGPGRRPVSNMTPTLVLKDGEPFLLAGSAGGPRIVTATLQTILNVIDHSMDIQDAVDAPRFHSQDSGVIRVERGIASKVRKELGEMGFETMMPNYLQLKPGFDVYFGGVNAILFRGRGEPRGGADTRRQGSVASY